MRRSHLAALSLLAALITACISIPGCTQTKDDNQVLVGEFSSLTGTEATFGTSNHHGLEIAVEETNATGGVLGKQINLLVEDDQSKYEEAATTVTKLITRDHVCVVIGEVASGRSLAAAPICQANKIPMVTPSSTNPKITQVGDYIFRTCFIDPFQGSVCARFSYNSLHAKKAAVLKDVKSEYSVGLDQFFSAKFTSLGGEIVGEQAYSGGDNDFKAQLTAIKAMNPDMIFVPGYYTEAALIIKQARDLGITIPIVGGDGWESARLFEIGGAAMKNTFYANHYTPSDTSEIVQHFVKAFEAKYHETPDAMAALAYDAGKIVFAAMTAAGTTDGPKLCDAIAAVKDYHGVTGTITIGPDRNAKKSAIIVEAKDGKPVFRERIDAEAND